MTTPETTDIAIIGAGPAGSTAAAMLSDKGWRVTVIERSHFPRFSIGESLLPQCMEFLDQAGMLEPLQQAAFQVKSGAGFAEGEQYGQYDFADQHSDGWDHAWHVVRAEFDQILATQAAQRGADVRFGESIDTVDFSTAGAPRLRVIREDGRHYELEARFICDASGFGRVLPKMLDLEQPTGAPPRGAIFTHVEDRISKPGFQRNRIPVSIHPGRPDVWHWLIPFSTGRSSIGVVGDPDFIKAQSGEPTQKLQSLTAADPFMADLLGNAIYDTPVSIITAYGVGVSRRYGQDFALLGNAGKFVDPIFSSGVTVALKSSVLACPLIDQQLRGQAVSWEDDFDAPLRAGVHVFETFIQSWYEGALKHVFFKADAPARTRSMIGSVLAGYVWDNSNPYVSRPEKRLRALCHACAP